MSYGLPPVDFSHSVSSQVSANRLGIRHSSAVGCAWVGSKVLWRNRRRPVRRGGLLSRGGWHTRMRLGGGMMKPGPSRVPFQLEVDQRETLGVPVPPPPNNLREERWTGDPDLWGGPFLSAEFQRKSHWSPPPPMQWRKIVARGRGARVRRRCRFPRPRGEKRTQCPCWRDSGEARISVEEAVRRGVPPGCWRQTPAETLSPQQRRQPPVGGGAWERGAVVDSHDTQGTAWLVPVAEQGARVVLPGYFAPGHLTLAPSLNRAHAGHRNPTLLLFSSKFIKFVNVWISDAGGIINSRDAPDVASVLAQHHNNSLISSIWGHWTLSLAWKWHIYIWVSVTSTIYLLCEIGKEYSKLFNAQVEACRHLSLTEYNQQISVGTNDLLAYSPMGIFNLLHELGKEDSQLNNPLIEANHHLFLAKDEERVDQCPYQQLLCKFLHLTLTLPNIAYFVGALIQFMQTPRVSCEYVANHIIKLSWGDFRPSTFLEPKWLVALRSLYKWLLCRVSRKSSFHYELIHLPGYLITWCSKEQGVVACSSAAVKFQVLVQDI